MAKRDRTRPLDVYDMTPARGRPRLDVSDLTEPDAEAPAPVTDRDVDETPPPPVRVVRIAAPPPRGDNEGLLGLVAGAVVGAALTLLLTPLSGADLRARLQGQLNARTGALANRAEALAQKLPNSTASGTTPATGEQNP